jgi:hypothetical protein
MSSNPKQFLRRRKGLLVPNTNPVDISVISQTNTGIVRMSKGTVYMNLNKGTEDEDTPYWLPIIVRDEFGNAVEMVRHSDLDDVMVNGMYTNNQARQNIPAAPPGGWPDRGHNNNT